MIELADLLLRVFKGREGLTAVGQKDGTWNPENGVLTPQVFADNHLAQVKPFGVYLSDKESKVQMACVDFDERSDREWKRHAEELYLELCRANLLPLVEVSQSGVGAHVWVFFRERIPAVVPRCLFETIGNTVSTYYKEIFPRQDIVADGGIGNMVRFPLWNKSHFVDIENDWERIDTRDALVEVRRYDELEVREAIQSLGGVVRKPQATTVSSMSGDARDESVSRRIEKLLHKKHTLLFKRWSGDPSGMDDRTPSAVAQSIATELVRCLVPPNEIAAALRVWVRQHNPKRVGREDWIERTIATAYNFAIERKERASVSAKTFELACLEHLDIVSSGELRLIPSGIEELDASIDGVAPGEVCIVAGRPSQGKSAVAAQWLDYASGLGFPCLMISEEMSSVELGKRRLLSISQHGEGQWKQKIAEVKREVEEYHKGRAPVYLVENCASIDRVESIIDQFCETHGVRLVAIDYLQLLGGRSDSEYELVTDISKRIKQAAKRNGCSILALSQMNRSIEAREGREPQLSDLRSSGQIEQDADMVIFAQWPWKMDTSKPQDEYLFWVMKRRNGPIRSPKVITTFNPDKQIIGVPLMGDN